MPDRASWIPTVQEARSMYLVGTHKEKTPMGMLDKKQYLTGQNGLFNEGDTLFLHNARVEEDGSVKLLVSREKDGEKIVCYSRGSAIVGAVRRIDGEDRRKMNAGDFHLRLDTLPPRQAGHSPTFVFSDANDPTTAAERQAQGTESATSGDDF